MCMADVSALLYGNLSFLKKFVEILKLSHVCVPMSIADATETAEKVVTKRFIREYFF